MILEAKCLQQSKIEHRGFCQFQCTVDIVSTAKLTKTLKKSGLKSPIFGGAEGN